MTRFGWCMGPGRQQHDACRGHTNNGTRSLTCDCPCHAQTGTNTATTGNMTAHTTNPEGPD